MENLLNNYQNLGEINYLTTLLSFILCILSALVLRHIYKIKSNSLTGKYHIGSIIPLLALTTFLVISVVKSSLALSLGLVGALSVIRFRTPVKEPEELIYLFFSIAVGIGYGAGQIVLTSFISFVIILIIWFFLSYNKKNEYLNYNLIIEYDLKKQEHSNEEIITRIKSIFPDFIITKFDINENLVEMNGRASISSPNKIDEFRKKLGNKLNVNFSEANIYY